MLQTQKLSISQCSRSVASQLMNETDELSDTELVKQVSDLKEQIHMLKLENEIIERIILRLEPGLMNGVQQAIDYANRLQSSTSIHVGGSFLRSQTSRLGFESLASPSRLLSSPSKISTRRVESCGRISGTIILGAGKKVNVLERTELVVTEMEIIMDSLDKTRNTAAKKHSLLRAQLEELSDRVDSVQKSTATFKQNVIIDGVDKIAQRIPAEIWIRYMTEWVKIADSAIGKLRLRTSTLNTQFSKFKSQIKMKQELSESLRPVDFEKLKIQNDECLGIIDKKLVHLGELKKMTGDANLTLTIHKNLMMEQNNYLNGILSTIKRKQKQTVQIDKEKDIIAEQVDKLSQKLDVVKKVRLTYEVPDVMEYVETKTELHDLKNGMKLLKNRNHIQQIALQSLNKKMMSLSIDH